MSKSQTTLIIYCQSKCVSDCSVYVWFCLTLTLWLWTFSLAPPAQWLPEPKKNNSNCDPRRPPLRQSSSNRLHSANQRQSEPLIHHESSHFQCSNLYSWPWILFSQWLAYYIERWYYAVYFQCLCDDIKNMIKLIRYDKVNRCLARYSPRHNNQATHQQGTE